MTHHCTLGGQLLICGWLGEAMVQHCLRLGGDGVALVVMNEHMTFCAL